jgi:uncharacterized protein YpmB
MYQIDPPDINQLTGERDGEYTIQHRGLTRFELTQVGEEAETEDYSNAIAPAHARKAVEANLPIFQENATDADVIGFWRSSTPLTDAEIDAIQSAYVATDNKEIADLLMFRMTGDTSHLNEDQLELLGLSGDEDYEESEEQDANEGLTAEEATDLIYNETAEPSEEIAEAILEVDLGNTDAASVVQYLAYKYFAGEVSVDDAYNEALNSGIDPDELTAAFNKLRTHFN